MNIAPTAMPKPVSSNSRFSASSGTMSVSVSRTTKLPNTRSACADIVSQKIRERVARSSRLMDIFGVAVSEKLKFTSVMK
jgi:hypothetical protein